MYKSIYYFFVVTILLIDSIANVNKKYYPLVFSNECKYIISKKKIKIISSIDEELIIDDSDH